MTKKKRYCISLDTTSDDIVNFLSKEFGCTKSKVIQVALAFLETGVISSSPYDVSKKLVDK